jgi:Phytanoyl-CoA dioxygenase (PhyH)
VDGLTPGEPDGRPGTFSLLAGMWLTDQSADRGNIWIWPGTHLRFGQYLAQRGADALTRVAEMGPGPYPRVELGEPVQATGPAGSVLFAHYLLAHNSGGHSGAAGAERRETIYYRLHADGHRQRWREAVTSPLLEFRQP